MQEDEMKEDKDAQETEAAGGAPEPQGEPGKPKKAMPSVPKGKFKKPEKKDFGGLKGKFQKQEKTDLSAAKGRFAAKKDGPVDKPSLDRFAKKAKMNPKIIYAAVGVVVVLVVIFLLLGSGTSLKNHAAYIRARNTIKHNSSVMEKLGGDVLREGGIPKLSEGQEKGFSIVEIENTVSGDKASGTFKAKAVYYRAQWQLIYLEVNIGGQTEILMDKELTEKGIMRKGR